MLRPLAQGLKAMTDVNEESSLELARLTARVQSGEVTAEASLPTAYRLGFEAGQRRLVAALQPMVPFVKPHRFARGALYQKVLSWLVDEQRSGRFPTSVEVGARFDLSSEEAEALRVELEVRGEF